MNIPTWLVSSWAHLQELTAFQSSLIALNISLLILSKPLFRLLLKSRQINEAELFDSRAFILLRRANWVSLLCVALYAFVLPLNQYFWFTKILSVLMIISVANLIDSMLDIFIIQRFGKKKLIDKEERFVETYRSRLVSLVASGMMLIIAILLIVRVIGFESMLETGGVIGFIGVLLALTQGSWAPDLISGLIILNTEVLEEGDVIEVHSAKPIIGTVFKTKLFHTELLDLATNHRVLIPNIQLRQSELFNLSKFASAKGLRERLSFKIGYDVRQSKVRQLFEEVFDLAQKDIDLPLNHQHGYDLRVLDTGDYAIEWGFFYYIKEVKLLLITRHRLLALIAQTAENHGISLATPILYQKVSEAEPESLLPAQAIPTQQENNESKT
jgi:hypothetical protein